MAIVVAALKSAWTRLAEASAAPLAELGPNQRKEAGLPLEADGGR